MIALREKLSDHSILTMESVRQYRLEILRAHPDITEKERAHMLAERLRALIDQELSGVSGPTRTAIRVEVFKESIRKGSLTLTQADMLDKLLSLELPPDTLQSELEQWLYKSCSIDTPKPYATKLIQEVHPAWKPPNQSKGHANKSMVLSAFRKQVNNCRNFLHTWWQKASLSLRVQLKENQLLAPTIFLLLLAGLLSGFMISIDDTPAPYTPPPPTFAEASQWLTSTDQWNLVFQEVLVDMPRADRGGHPDFLAYHTFSHSGVISYLDRRNSIFTDPEKINVLVRVGKEYDLHPLLLLAIIGQEQGFVPKDHKYVQQIMNNPFNVYTSWESYNTTLHDSTEIAAGTVIVLLRERPPKENPFKWINNRYAEDPNWWKGVQELFYTLLSHSTDT